MKRIRVALTLVLLGLPAAGCGAAARNTGFTPADPPAATVTSDAPGAPGASSAPAAPPSSPAATSAARPGRKPPTGTREIEVERDLDESPIVTGARFAEHDGFDRVVIDVKGALPGYTVRWVPKLVQEGSGDPIDATGGAYLEVRMRPAAAHGGSGKPTWTGGPIFQAGLGNVQNVVKTGDFEGVVGVGIVLDHRAGFRVTEQRSPNRLVIDVAH
ncbi:AMIN-like domain-containing (lipo)protein [Streptosporangium sandarakinum]|uniref:AMIN-like domain-containing (lipo)protein n=1 Tax=Streptosporangium sandarakinum TaxID=1260955 RepID=UPI003683B6AE